MSIIIGTIYHKAALALPNRCSALEKLRSLLFNILILITFFSQLVPLNVCLHDVIIYLFVCFFKPQSVFYNIHHLQELNKAQESWYEAEGHAWSEKSVRARKFGWQEMVDSAVNIRPRQTVSVTPKHYTKSESVCVCVCAHF